MTRIERVSNGPEKRIRVVIYVRVSSKNQDVENSSDAQISECKAYIEKMGWELVGIYVDKALSGRNDKRPLHSLMIHDGTRADREFDKVVVWKMDRYARDENHATLTKAMLRKNGVEVISVTEPIGEGKFARVFETLLDLLAEIQSEGIAENVKRGTRHLAAQGYYLGAKAPYGYRIEKVKVDDREHQKLELDPETWQIARDIFDSALAGNSLSHIGRDLYAKGIPSPEGNPRWPSTTLSGMLHNLQYTGTIVWSMNTEDEEGAIYCPDAHLSIISRRDFDEIQKLLAARHYKPKDSEAGEAGNNPRELGSRYLLSGIITCQLCGAKVYPKPANSGKDAYYTCKQRLRYGKEACDCPNRNMVKLEPLVMNQILNDILTDANMQYLIDQVGEAANQSNVDFAQQMSDLEKRLDQIGRRQDRALQAFELDSISQAKYLERMNELQGEKQRVEEEKAAAEAVMGDEITILTDPGSVRCHASQVRDFLETVEASEWKPIIRKFVKNVSIGHTHGVITYKIPLPDDDPFVRRMTSQIDLSGKILSSIQSAPTRRERIFNLRASVSYQPSITDSLRGSAPP